MFNEKEIQQPIPYYLKGSNPKLLLLSGEHGDEYRVINPLVELMKKAYSDWPDFLYIPEVSPSAVSRKNRLNYQLHDINRVFYDDSGDLEVQAILSILKNRHFPCCLSFHMDTSGKELYWYDTGKFSEQELSVIRNDFQETGIPLYTGIDDDRDPILQCNVEGGYVSFQDYPKEKTNGSLSYLLVKKGIVDRVIIIEVPGLYDDNTVKQITEITHSIFLSKLLPKK